MIPKMMALTSGFIASELKNTFGKPNPMMLVVGPAYLDAVQEQVLENLR